MNTLYHSQSSVKHWGGKIEDYYPIHDFIDSTKASFPDIRHRFLLHNSFGIFLVEKIIGKYITLENDRQVPVREIAERHIIEDLGFIPTVEDWARCMPLSLTKWAGGHISVLLRENNHVPTHIREKYKEYKGK